MASGFQVGEAYTTRGGVFRRTHVKLGLIGPPVFGLVFKSLMLDDDDPPAANYPHDGAQARFLDELKGVCGVPTITGYRSVTVDSRIAHPLRLSDPCCLMVDCAVQTAEHLECSRCKLWTYICCVRSSARTR